ncbi:organic cation transporter protein-like [Ptychodera flava]|uniref:organic cation transporter protein-like n=1 Tax=Ptychodera flava TaxID=63121 RepID=UPI003969E82C
MSVEDILHTVGDTGRYQKLILVLISFTFVLQTLFGLVNVFFTMTSDHYCRVYSNQTYELDSPLKRATIPRTHHENQTTWDSCHMYNMNESMIFDSYLANGTASNRSSFVAMGVHPCDHSWVFDRSSVSNTLVMEFNLVCDRFWLQQLPKSTYAFAGIFGSLIFGPLSDAYGRKPTYFFTLIIALIFNLLMYLATTFSMFVICQFLMGIVSPAIYNIGHLIVVEMVTTKTRPMALIVPSLAHPICELLLAGMSYAARSNWRIIQLVVLLGCLLTIPYYWILDESPRWLYQQGRVEETEKLFEKIAKWNKTTYQRQSFKSPDTKEEEDNRTSPISALTNLFVRKELRCRTISISVGWLSIGTFYYGVGYNFNFITNNTFTNLILGLVSISDVIGYLLCWLMLKYLPRRWLLFSSIIITALCWMVAGMVGNEAVKISFVVVAKMFAVIQYIAFFAYSAELYPTEVRNASIGLGQTLAYIGATVAPYIFALMDINPLLPFIIISSLLVVGGVMVLLLPETFNEELMDSIDDITKRREDDSVITKKGTEGSRLLEERRHPGQ